QPGGNSAREFQHPRVSSAVAHELLSIRGDHCHRACTGESSEISALPVPPDVLPAASPPGHISEDSLVGCRGQPVIVPIRRNPLRYGECIPCRFEPLHIERQDHERAPALVLPV